MAQAVAPLIPHSRPWIAPADVRAVSQVLRRGALAQGVEVAAFETEVAGRLGLPPGVAVSSGTAALHLALLGLGIGPGDEVILPSYVCVAPLHAVQYVGATPRLADVDPLSYNLDPADVRRRIGRRTRAIIVPHLFGLPTDLDAILALGLPVIEDCAQAFGARYRGRPVGTFGAVGIASFYATKLLTTGEGGMLLSSDRSLLARVRDRRDYDERRRHALRFNYKLTDLQAALGRSQLRRFPAMLARRAAIASRYRRRWAALPVRLPVADAGRTHVYHRYVVAVPGAAAAVAERLRPLGVIARLPVFRPIHLTLGMSGFPGAAHAFRHALSLPLYPALTSREEAVVVRALQRVLE
ncbi:MAG TPA: DegT/DnrJ/EryC1/StrS aminotransferase family protein [Candidatus Acidoferrum sp.]|nr:DegT/DnrJ/EryC1/StrS aminotransferase family protein [Candidatus Acidoferrum sp.]